MEKIKTYIINLEKSYIRKQYMERLLQPYSFLNTEFVKAINGHEMSAHELDEVFDNNSCMKHRGRYLNKGEIGCTLSHRKCYKKILDDEIPFALILEDDIAVLRNLNYLQELNISSVLDVERPIVLFLSGDYWFWKNREITNVYDAVGSYAYFINSSAAKLIMSIQKPYSVSDDWIMYKSLGVKLMAVKPYMIDANVNMELLGSDVLQDEWGISRRKMSKLNAFISYKDAVLKKIFKMFGHFESKIRVINNKIVS